MDIIHEPHLMESPTINRENQPELNKPVRVLEKRHTIHALLIGLLSIILLVVIYQVWTKINLNLDPRQDLSSTTNIISPTVSPIALFTYTPDLLTQKQTLINSNYIDDVMEAIKLGHVVATPFSERNFSQLNLKAYKLESKEPQWHEKLMNHIGIMELNSAENATISNNTWKAYSYAEAADMYTKDGYVCIIVALNRFSEIPEITCSYLLDISQNTIENVSSFMRNVLSQAGFYCSISSCPVTETKTLFPLNKYGRDVVDFDKTIFERDVNIQAASVINEASESAKFLELSGWQVSLMDDTTQENAYGGNATLHLKIEATNALLACFHSITIMPQGKRQMISCNYKEEMLEAVQQFYNPYKVN